MDIADIHIALYSHYPRLYYYVPPPIKTLTCSNTHGCRGTYPTIASLTILPIAGMLGAITTTTNTEYIRVYLAIAISAYVNIVYK